MRCELVLFVAVGCGLAFGAEISSKIDLDEDDKELTTPPSTISTSLLKAFVDLNKGAGPKLPGLVAKEPPKSVRYPGIKLRGDDFVSIEEFLRDRKRQGVGQNFQEESAATSTTPMTIINNIHVTINGNESEPGVKGCKDGVCNVRVMATPDGAGNMVTDVHLSVVTKTKNKVTTIEDVPVIDGVRGLDNERTPGYDEFPTIHLLDQPAGPFNIPYYDNNIPQVPVHRPNAGDYDVPWYQVPKIFVRPNPSWHYSRSLERDRKAPRSGHQKRVPSRGVVDDKIEQPLSKTKPSHE